MRHFSDFLAHIRHDAIRHHIIFAGVCLGCLWLVFPGLDDYALWVDEAETGFVAKGVLSRGLPYAYDGVQPYPGPSRYYNEHLLWMETPWIQFYVTALSFNLLGVSSFSARLPFVIIGLLSALFFYRIAQRLSDTAVARVTVVLLLTSVPYLLHIRQCRYFALLAFGTAWGLWAYLKFKDGERFAVPHLIGASVFLFYSHYAYFFAFMTALGLCMILYYRSHDWKRLLLIMGCIFALTFPWVLYADLIGRRASYGGWSSWLIVNNLGYYVGQVHLYVFPVMTLPLAVFVLDRSAWRRRLPFFFLSIPVLWVVYSLMPILAHAMPWVQRFRVVLGAALFLLIVVWAYRAWARAPLLRDQGRLLLAFVFGIIAGLAIVIPNNAFRYIVGILPVLYLLMAILIMALWRRSKLMGAAGSVCLAGTNLLAAVPFALIHWLPFNAQRFEGIMQSSAISARMSRLTGMEATTLRVKLPSKLEALDRTITQSAVFRSYLIDYAYQLAYPYPGPVEAVIQYLQTHASPGDTFSTDSDLVILAFYTGLKPIPISIKTERITADWVSIRPHHFYATHPGWWIRHFYDDVLAPGYEKIELDAPDLSSVVYHLPDPNIHIFRVDRTAYPKMVLFHRKTAPMPSRKKGASSEIR